MTELWCRFMRIFLYPTFFYGAGNKQTTGDKLFYFDTQQKAWQGLRELSNVDYPK